MDGVTAPSRTRRRAFALLAVSIPALTFGALEGALRALHYQGDLSLFVRLPYAAGQYMGVNDRVAARYFLNVRMLPTPPTDIFLAAKPTHGFRVFVLGESSAAGFPYLHNGTFARVLQDALQDVMPGDTVEVVNLGVAAITSYALYDEIDEILAQHPDAVVLYAGHNEFYGALGVGSTETLGAVPALVRTYLRGVAQFRDNLRAILTRFRAARVPVFIGSLTSNLRDQPPLRSVATATLPPAERVFSAARQALARGDRAAARQLFAEARDLDALRFRAPGEFNAIIRALARATGAHYVPVDEAFAAASTDGIPGAELFWEHLHPNQTGYHLMGQVFFAAIEQAGFLGRAADTTRLRRWPAYYDRMALTEFDRRFAWHEIRSLETRWPFVEHEDRTGYPRNYRPLDPADSLAWAAANTGVRWVSAKFDLADYYRSRGQLQLALAEYRGLIREQPENPALLVFVGGTLLRLHDLEHARALLERAYALEPSGLTCYALGTLELNAQHSDRAIQLLEQSQQFHPDNPAVLFDLSHAYALARDVRQARAYADRLARVSPEFPGLDQWRARLATLPDRKKR